MKKLLTAIIAVLYLGTSTGATVHMHYCMGKLADWGFTKKESSACSKCGMKKQAQKERSCCKDEHKFLKNDTDQKAFENAFKMAQSVSFALPVSFYEIPSVNIPTITECNPISHAPPGDTGIAVYIRNCVFLI